MSVLTIEHATFSYDEKKDILRDLNLEMSDEEVLCILGPNGIGKTTLLKTMLKLFPLKSGDIKVDGKSIYSMSQKEMAKNLALIPQTIQFTFPYKVLDVVLMGRTPHLNGMAQPSKTDYQKAMDAIELMDLTDLIYRPCSRLSGGQLQLVVIARALAQEAKFLLLDEPTSHLDYGKQMQTLGVLSKMKKNHVGVIMTSHNPDHAFMVCDKVAIMNGGVFTSVGKPDDVITKEALKGIYGIDVDIIRYEGAGNRKVCIPIY